MSPLSLSAHYIIQVCVVRISTYCSPQPRTQYTIVIKSWKDSKVYLSQVYLLRRACNTSTSICLSIPIPIPICIYIYRHTFLFCLLVLSSPQAMSFKSLTCSRLNTNVTCMRTNREEKETDGRTEKGKKVVRSISLYYYTHTHTFAGVL